jgi:hypothetical protein
VTPRRNPWPWPADSVLDRAKRVAWAYRAALAQADPARAQHIDDWAVHHGQSWIQPSEWPYGDDELLTISQVADLCHVERGTVYRWHQRGLALPVHRGRPAHPRHRPGGMGAKPPPSTAGMKLYCASLAHRFPPRFRLHNA